MTRLWQHMRTLWPRWTLLPPAPIVLWCAYCIVVRGERRWEQVLLPLLIIGLAYGNATSKKLVIGLYPLALVGLAYDAMRFVKNVGLSPDTIHTCDLQAMDARLFGIRHDGVLQSLPDFFYTHHWDVLDALAAIPYGTFIYATVLYAGYLFVRDFTAIQRLAWTFFVVNMIGFTTYHLYPAAPPWYVHAHGCRADLLAHASEGSHLARVDAWLGFRYFAGFYSRSNDIFGAVPSLHVAYPFLMALEGWRRHKWLGKSLTSGFFVAMCCSAVYLDHHWVFDVVLGLLYTIVSYTAVSWYFARHPEPKTSVALHTWPKDAATG